MRYFLDTEFIEDGRIIDLVSIGILAEDGREYYAISSEFDASKAGEWVKENVLSKLAPRSGWKTKKTIVREVAKFLGCDVEETYHLRYGIPGLWDKFLMDYFPKKATKEYKITLGESVETPEIWAYYADYDWVVFCQLFGTMEQLPKGFPMFCRDLKQFADQLGNPDLPEQDERTKHGALSDAMHNKVIWDFLRECQRPRAEATGLPASSQQS